MEQGEVGFFGIVVQLAALAFFAIGLGRNRAVTVPLTLLPDAWPFVGVGFWMVYVLHTGVAAIEWSRSHGVSHSASN